MNRQTLRQSKGVECLTFKFSLIQIIMMKLSRPQYGLEEEIVEAIYALREKKSS